MAKNISLLTLKNKIRDRGEFYNTAWLTDSELVSHINDSIAALYDFLITIDSGRYLTTSSEISIVAGTRTYDLPSDFYIVVGVDLVDDSHQSGYRTMSRFNWGERHDNAIRMSEHFARYDILGNKLWIHPKPDWAGSVVLRYIPVPVELSADEDTFDSVNSWTDWVVLDCLIKIGHKEGLDTKGWQREQGKTEMRIASIGETNRSEPKTVNDSIGVKKIINRRVLM